ncbi:ureidoglycolate dehydrogenase [Geomicrobium sp. JSM 1781026]|uniref:ureidoglycolate dehydrogenase n=1 Tax=Geomicrobium sp. JSM 1781026 TaxID=3344580 RepID=UPI0035BF2326
MGTLTEQQLTDITTTAFTRGGIPKHIAEHVTDVLVHANLRGVDSHGVLRVEHYLRRVAEGGLDAHAEPTFTKTSPSTGILDGNNGFGHYIAKEAMNQSIQIAKEQGIGAVAVKNSSHCGALSYFVQQAADAGMIGLAMTHTDKVVVPFGGTEPFFGTNPIAFGFPSAKEESVILDFATSTVALGKILQAKEKGQSIPEGWGVDKDGNSTTDPHQVVSLTPFGGPKGYGLAMVVEIFSALLTGAAFGPHVSKMYGDYGQNRELGHFVLALDLSVFTHLETFTKRMDIMIRELRSIPAIEGNEGVFVPGEIETQTAKTRKQSGIPLPGSVYEFLMENGR